MTAIPRTFTLNVTSNAGPAWLQAKQEGAWIEIASAGLSTAYQWGWPVGIPKGTLAAPNAGLWLVPKGLVGESGYSADYVNKRLIEYLGGGHGDVNGGNEGYELDLLQESPAWVRLNDGTPAAMYNFALNGGATVYTTTAEGKTLANDMATCADQRPRACHTCDLGVYANGRIWWANQSAFASTAGADSAHVHSVDVQRCRDWLASHNGQPFPHPNVNPSAWAGVTPQDSYTPSISGASAVWTDPWRSHGPQAGSVPGGVAAYGFGCAVADMQGYVWTVGALDNRIYRINTNSGGSWGTHGSYGIDRVAMSADGTNTQGAFAESWMVCIPGADIEDGLGDALVAVRAHPSNAGGTDPNVVIFRPQQLTVSTPLGIGPVLIKRNTNALNLVWGGSTFGNDKKRWGAAYHSRSRKILAYKYTDGAIPMYSAQQANWDGFRLRRLRPPVAPSGKVDLSSAATWVWDELVLSRPAGTGYASTIRYPSYGSGGAVGKVKIFDNVSPGVDVLTYAPDYEGPVYAIKLIGGSV